MKYLGIDYGEAKIGLAISDGSLAQPLGVISKISQIDQICQKNNIEKIVVGISEGKMAQKTKKFGEQISRLTGLCVEYQDETLSSQKAQEAMIQAGKPQRRKKQDEHAISAALILQEWLDIT